MSKQGFIKLYRQVQDHWIYDEKRKFSKYEAWLDMLMMANHKEAKFVLGNELVELKKGEFVTSELKLMERWDWGKAKLRSFLDLLEKDEMIVKKSDRKKTTITICNYCVYHDYETENRPQADREQTDSRPRADTNKNNKEQPIITKNDKERINNTSSPKQVYDEASVPYQLALRLYQNILVNNPNHKKPNLQTWANEVRLMVERDKRTEAEIIYLMDWVQNDSFWKTNILSVSKLREKFDQLVIKVKEDISKRNNQVNSKPKAYRSLEDWADEE